MIARLLCVVALLLGGGGCGANSDETLSESTTAEVLTPATTSEPSTQAWKYYAKIETALEYADNIIEALPVTQAGLQQCLRYPTTQNQWEEPTM